MVEIFKIVKIEPKKKIKPVQYIRRTANRQYKPEPYFLKIEPKSVTIRF